MEDIVKELGKMDDVQNALENVIIFNEVLKIKLTLKLEKSEAIRQLKRCTNEIDNLIYALNILKKEKEEI